MTKLTSEIKGIGLYILTPNEKKTPKEIKSLVKKAQQEGKLKKDGDEYFLYSEKEKMLIIRSTIGKEMFELRNLMASVMKHNDDFTYIPNESIKPLEKQLYVVVETFNLANYEFDNYKKDKSPKKMLYILSKGLKDTNKIKKIIKKAEIVANAVNYTRTLANTPPNIATPEFMANEAKKLKKAGLEVNILDKKQLKKMGLNAILAVNAGSQRNSYLIHLAYKPKKKSKVKIAIAGKGITFDTGGLGLKPSKYMLNMHLDKSGACAVLGIMKAVSELKPQLEIHGFLGVTENAIGPTATPPNSIIKSYSGKTIEIQHTDAEGRLVLADVVAYAEKKVKPDYIIDIATLTGAMSIALGDKAIGIFSNNEELAELFKELGMESGERGWPFPMWKDYDEMLKSDFADIKNIGSWEGKAGSITGAKFIGSFIEKTPWVHLDIASMMNEGFPYMKKGATGVGVRIVLKFIERLENEAR